MCGCVRKRVQAGGGLLEERGVRMVMLCGAMASARPLPAVKATAAPCSAVSEPA